MGIIKKILKKLVYIFLFAYLLAMFGAMISSGAVLTIVFAVLIFGYIVVMFVSIKSARRLEKLKEKVMLDLSYVPTKKDRVLFHSLIVNLPFYYIYFAFSLMPFEIPGYWMIAGFPCCLISALRPINKNYQTYNFITSKSKLYWWLQIALAIIIWAIGRTVILSILD